ncbi:MAG: DUF493 family protein [Bacteroidota bacterium]
MGTTTDSFKEKLENEYEWPALYTFKFIVPEQKIEALKSIFEGHEIVEKASSKGNYISLTSKIMAQSSDFIIETYMKASKIDGIISL